MSRIATRPRRGNAAPKADPRSSTDAFAEAEGPGTSFPPARVVGCVDRHGPGSGMGEVSVRARRALRKVSSE